MDNAKLASYLSLAGTVVAGLATLLSPDIQAFWAAHPAYVGLVGSVLSIINLFLPQPHK